MREKLCISIEFLDEKIKWQKYIDFKNMFGKFGNFVSIFEENEKIFVIITHCRVQ